MNKTKSIILKSISLWLILFFSYQSNAQYNLVSNSSFETYTNCPLSPNNSPLPYPWYHPTNQQNQDATYFNTCSYSSTYGVPRNYWGYQNARTGNAYAAISTISIQYPNSERYYCQAILKDSLKKGKNYYVEFYVSNYDNIRYVTNNIGMLFSQTAIYVDTISDPLGVLQNNAQLVNYGNPIINDTSNWVKISGIYKAQGGEKYITIGNFKTNSQTNFTQLNNIQQNCICTAYYLDDVSVIPLDSMCLKADAGKDITISAGDSAFIGSYTNGIDSLLWLENGITKRDSTRPGFYAHPSSSTFYVLQQTVNSCFSSDTVWVNVLLPLKFISYNLVSSLRGTKQSIENKWSTSNEINVSHYNIQRSVNGKDFVTIGKVKANNKNYNEYNFIDENVNEGINYYRIESIDNDGKKQYSVIRTLNIHHSSLNVVVFPNPAKDVLNIHCTEGVKEIEITDYLGRLVYKNITKNINHLSLNTNHYGRGIYFIKVLNCNTGNLTVQKVILQ